MLDITHFATSEQVTVRRVALSKAAQLAGAAFDAVSCGRAVEDRDNKTLAHHLRASYLS